MSWKSWVLRRRELLLANGSSRGCRLDSHLASKFRSSSRDWSLTYARTIVLVRESAKTRTIHSRTNHYPSEITVDCCSLFLTSTRSKVLVKELNFELRPSLVSKKRMARHERLIHRITIAITRLFQFRKLNTFYLR